MWRNYITGAAYQQPARRCPALLFESKTGVVRLEKRPGATRFPAVRGW